MENTLTIFHLFPLIRPAAGQPCAYRVLLADSYHQTTIEMMANSESAKGGKYLLALKVNEKLDAQSLDFKTRKIRISKLTFIKPLR